jgi:hypothetical protein
MPHGAVLSWQPIDVKLPALDSGPADKETFR